MRAMWLTVLVLASAAQGAEPSTSSKAGLWLLERHSNMPMFLVPQSKSPQEAAARSDAMLKMPGSRREICLSEEGQRKIVEKPALPAGCTVPEAKSENGTAVMDATCEGKSYHTVLTADQNHHTVAMRSDITDAKDANSGGTVEARYESPTHITIRTTLNRQENGVHMIDVMDFQKISDDCGSLKPGESRKAEKAP